MAMMNLGAFLFLLEMLDLAFASRRSGSFSLSLSLSLSLVYSHLLASHSCGWWENIFGDRAVSTIYCIATITQLPASLPGVFASSVPSQSSYPDNQLAKENRGLLVINTAWITPSH
ncbi:hypothetical protein B0T18DRAFT_421902, partial [Schizothecium vesticola]